MDYSEVPLHKRTRHQFDLFYKRCHEERQKAKSRGSSGGGSSDAACGVGGGAELSGSVSGGREERGSEVNLAKKGENAGDVKGFGSRNSEKKKGLISESRKGFRRANNRAEIGVGSDRDGKKSKEGVLVKKGIRELQKDVDSKKLRGNSKRGLKGTNAIQIDTSDDENGDDGSDDEVEILDVIYNSSNRGWPKAKGKDSDYMDAKEAVSSDQEIGGGEGVMSDQGKESGVAGQTQLDSGSSKESQTDSVDSIDVGDGEKSDQKKESGVVNQTPSDSESQTDSEELESSSEEDNEDDKDFVGDDSDGRYSSSSSEDRNDKDENEDEEKEQEKDEDDEVVLLEEDLEDEDDDECRVVEIESVVGKGKEKSIEVGLKRKYKPRQVKDAEGLSSIGVAEEGKDELESSIMEGGSIDEVEKDRSIEGGLKRRKFSGLDILVDSSKVKSEETKSVANRLRSRSVPKSKRRKLNLGTISRPLTVDDLDSTSGNDEDTDENDMKDTEPASKSGQKGRRKLVKRPVRNHIRGPTDCDLVIEDELDPFSGSDDVGDENDAKVLPRTSAEVEGISSKPTERRHIDAVGNKALDHSKGNRDDSDENVGKDVLNIGRKGNGKFEMPTGGRHVHTRKGFDPLKILTDSIWEKGSSLLEDTVPPSPVEEVPAETTLVYKFRFEDEVPKPPEKSYWDQQSDVLFEEMAMALRSSEIGSSSSAIEDDFFPTRTEASPTILCQRGIHEYILDDQIGLICRICSFVEVEIKHILPSFCKNHPRGRSGNQYYGKDGCSFFTELQSQYPVPEHQDGRVCTKGTVWDLVPGIKDLYPHQCEGFEFMWKNVAGGIYIDKLEKPLSGAGGGCIISHAPGTGKTLMTIVFLQSFLNLYPESKPLIVAPKSMLLTWEEEFRKWKVDIPFHNLNKPELSGKENTVAVNFLKRCGYRRWNTNAIRFLKLYSWIKDRSIVGISYNLFGRLAGEGVKEGLDGKIRRVLLEIPTLLVLDEGHTARNDHSIMWNALSKVETQRCIILSGTPFQNNCGELYNILCLVSPNLVGRMSSKDHGDLGKKDGRESKSARRKWASLTSSDVNIRDIKAIVDPLVHIYKGTILDKLLHGCKKALVVLKPTDLQKSLTESIQTRNFLERDRMVSLISVHPSLLLQCYSPEDEGFSAYWGECEQLKLDHRGGVKTKFLIELIRLCGALKEKVLVFSQYLDPLAFLMKQLKACFNWTEGREVLYIDGQHDIKQRQLTISSLNDPTSDVQVLLASIKACSEGINLVGASRVVLLDIGWNPSVERQAICRAYRIGQKKTVYIYHLITSGTMEGKKCERQAEKDLLSQKVFSSADMESCKPKVLSEVSEDKILYSEDKILDEMLQHKKLRDIFESITYQPRAPDLLATPDLVDR